METAIEPGTIGLNVNGLMYNGGYNRANQFGLKLDYVPFLQALVTRLLQETSAEVLLVPHTLAPVGDVESDNEASFKLRASLPAARQPRVRVVTGDFDCHNIKGIINSFDFFVGSRMHSCIGALSQNAPCVGVAYSMRFKGVFATVGMSTSVVDARTSTSLEASSDVMRFYAAKAQNRQHLEQATLTARNQLDLAFHALVATGSTGS